ncbi:MAG: alpha/beta hydrolase [Nocardiopsaceae bacterium]|nr:alpha/beta hydrolase [Nocardiopsaceae bacterium]
MATVGLEAGEFHYTEYGDPGAPPLVLLHGLTSDRSTWGRTAPELAAVGYRVLALDQRGHGGSPHTGTYSFEEMREDLRQFADALGLDRIVLGGHSMGGTVAELFAERYPGRLAGLIVMDSPPPEGHGALDPGPRPDRDLSYDWAAVSAICAQLGRPDPAWWTQLPTVTCPTLVIGGGSTSPVPQDLLARMARLLPDAALVTIEGAGHRVHQTRPGEFLDAVRPFLRRISGGLGQIPEDHVAEKGTT